MGTPIRGLTLAGIGKDGKGDLGLVLVARFGLNRRTCPTREDHAFGTEKEASQPNCIKNHRVR